MPKRKKQKALSPQLVERKAKKQKKVENKLSKKKLSLSLASSTKAKEIQKDKKASSVTLRKKEKIAKKKEGSAKVSTSIQSKFLKKPKERRKHTLTSTKKEKKLTSSLTKIPKQQKAIKSIKKETLTKNKISSEKKEDEIISASKAKKEKKTSIANKIVKSTSEEAIPSSNAQKQTTSQLQKKESIHEDWKKYFTTAINKLIKLGGIKKVLFTIQKPERLNPYSEILKKYEVECEFRPFYAMEPISIEEFKKQKLHILEHDAIVFLNRWAVDFFFKVLNDTGIPIKENWRYFCIGRGVTNYIAKYIPSFKKKLATTVDDIYELIDVMKSHPEFSYIIPIGKDFDESFANQFKNQNLKVTLAAFYNVKELPVNYKSFKDYEVIIIFSANAAKSFANLVKKNKSLLDEVILIAREEETAKVLRSHGIEPDIIVPNKFFSSGIDALISLINAYRLKTL